MSNVNQSWLYTPKPITWWRSLGFAMNDLNGGAWGTLTGSYLMFFMTTYAGLSPLEVGGMFFACKMIDIIVCAVIGGVSDNLFKYPIGRLLGRRHSLLLAGAIMIIIGFPMLFQVKAGSYWWYFLVYFLIDTANAFIGIAYETLPTEMTPKADERVRLSSVRLFVSAFSTFAVTALPALLMSILPAGADGKPTAEAYTIAGYVFGVVFATGTLITFFSTWEFSPQYVEEFESKNKVVETNTSWKDKIFANLREYYMVWKNKSCRRMFTIYFVSYFAKDCYMTAFLYFIVFILGMSQAMGQTILSLSFIGMIVVPVATVFMMKKGPKFLWTIAYTAMLAVLAGFFFMNTMGVKWVWLLFVLGILFQIGRQTMEYTCWQVIPFCPDVDTLGSTKLRAGTFAAVQTLSRRATGALGSALIGLILTMGGFDAKSEVLSGSAQTAIIFVFLIFPALLICYAFYLAKTFNLDQNTHKVVMDEIERLKNGGSKDDVKPETKAIVEDLTGYKYEEIWDVNK